MVVGSYKADDDSFCILVCIHCRLEIGKAYKRISVFSVADIGISSLVLYVGHDNTGSRFYQEVQLSCYQDEVPYFDNPNLCFTVKALCTLGIIGSNGNDICNFRIQAGYILSTDTDIYAYDVCILHRLGTL